VGCLPVNRPPAAWIRGPCKELQASDSERFAVASLRVTEGRESRRVVVWTAHDLGRWQRDAAAGLRPGFAPYGLEHFARALDVQFVQWKPPLWFANTLVGRLANRLERIARFSLVQPVLGARLLSSSRFALAVLESEGYLHAILSACRIRPWSRVPVVYLACFLVDDATKAGGFRLRVLRRCARSAGAVVVWSENQVEECVRLLGVDRANICSVSFGVETEFYESKARPPATEPYVFAAGRDRARDFPTLLAAASVLSVKVKIACPLTRLQGLEVPANVDVLGELSHAEYRTALHGAKVVAIASRPGFAYPTGQTVMLNAMAAGVPVVVTASDALRGYVADRVNARVVRPDDPEALAAAISDLLDDDGLSRRLAEAAKRDVLVKYNAERMWREVAAFCEARFA
jgi:glycosyltransferase involved in cell wall biosynthesis